MNHIAEKNMNLQYINLTDLEINRTNDRHGELENATAAIAWLFNSREIHMRNLAKDIVEQSGIYEPPLVSTRDRKFQVFDGNRRETCLKLLQNPKRAPTSNLQIFFKDLKSQWSGKFPEKIQCQVETDKDRIDEILFRRHTGTQKGVGQSNWDDRMQSTFVSRTGKGSNINVADEIEKQLEAADLLPQVRKIPRSNMNRLLSAEPFRNRLGFTVRDKKFQLTHQENVVLNALHRVANDLASRKIVLGDIWDVDSKTAYLDRLEIEGVLPTAKHALSIDEKREKRKTTTKKNKSKKASPSKRLTLIPEKDFEILWPGRLQRHHAIWEELQFRLRLVEHPNPISVLFRVLLELSVKNYILQNKLEIPENDKLSKKVLNFGEHQHKRKLIDKQTLLIVKKFQNADQLVSADTLNIYVHSPNFAPSPQHLSSLWDSLAEYIVNCLKA